MANLNLDKNEAEFLEDTISYWQQQGLLDAEKAEELKATYEIKRFDWRRLAQYSFWIALACGLIAVASLLVNDALLNLLKRLYDTPDIVISFLTAALAAWFYFMGYKSKRASPERILSNEATLFAGVLFTAISIAFLGRALDNGAGHFSLLFLLSVLIYAALAVKFNSKLIWVFALISLGSWFGTETGYQTNWGDYFLRMNYPLRFVFFGAALTAAGFYMKRIRLIRGFNTITYIVGMFYLFISLWLLSIFGNFGNLEDWFKVRQFDIVYYSIVLLVVSLGFMFYGLKYKDAIAREFGITFLLINLYTRYFEFFWDITDKAIFFGILAVSFWLIGRRAERIWNLR